jgi:hypothetical protein
MLFATKTFMCKHQNIDAPSLITPAAEAPLMCSQGWTPLMSAVSANKEPLVKLLLEHGADVHATNSSGQTCLHYAVSPYSPAKNMMGACLKDNDSVDYLCLTKPAANDRAFADESMTAQCMISHAIKAITCHGTSCRQARQPMVTYAGCFWRKARQ